MSTLTKDFRTTIIPSTYVPGTDGTPGQAAWTEVITTPGIPERTVLAFTGGINAVGGVPPYVLVTMPAVPASVQTIHHPERPATPPTDASGSPTGYVLDSNPGWNAGAIHATSLAGDGYLSFTAGISTGTVLGFSSTDPQGDQRLIDFAFYLGEGRATVIERGVTSTQIPMVTGKEIKIARVGSVVTYYINEAIVHVSAVESTGTLFTAVSMYFAGEVVPPVTVASTVGLVSGSAYTALHPLRSSSSDYAFGEASVTLTALKSVSGVARSPVSRLQELRSVSSDRAYGYSTEALPALRSTAESGGLVAPPYAFAQTKLTILIGVANVTTSQSGEGIAVLPGLKTFSSDHQYAGSNGVISGLTSWAMASPPPANDMLANAEAIFGASGWRMFNNTLATTEPGEDIANLNPGDVWYRSVWYEWQAPMDGTVTFDTLSSRLDTVLTLYSGDRSLGISALEALAENDDADTATDNQSELTYSVTAGTTYTLKVANYDNGVSNSGEYGIVILRWSSPDMNALVAPPPTLLATGSVHLARARITAPAPLVTGSGSSPTGHFVLYCPTPTVLTYGHDSTGEQSAELTAPSPTATGFGGATARATAPRPSLAIMATVTNFGAAALSVPVGLPAATGTTSALAGADLKASTGRAVGYSGAMVSITLTGKPTVLASGTTGGIGGAQLTAPLFELTASGTAQNYGGASLLAPSPELARTAQAWLVAPGAQLAAIGTAVVVATYEAYAVNLNHRPPKPGEPVVDETTHYTAFPFTHVVRYQNSYYGANSTGLYLLEGTTDDAVPIPWAVKTAVTDFDIPTHKTVASAYFGGRLGPADTITLHAGEGAQTQAYSYTTPRGALAQNYRQVFGKGVKARYYSLGAAGTGTLELDDIEFDIHTLTRRI